MTTKPVEVTKAHDHETIERWSPEEVDQAKLFYGHEPNTEELRAFNRKGVQE